MPMYTDDNNVMQIRKFTPINATIWQDYLLKFLLANTNHLLVGKGMLDNNHPVVVIFYREII